MLNSIKAFIVALWISISSILPGHAKIPSPTPFINNTPVANYINDYNLFGKINDYRESIKLPTFSLDDETCKIAENILNTKFWQTGIQINDYKNYCSSCTSLTTAESQSEYNLDAIINSWKNDKVTLANLKSDNTYACVKVSGDKVVLALTSKSGVDYVNNINTDQITDCVSSAPNCNGSSIRLKQSQCSNITCCQVGNTWTVYSSNTACTQAQNNYNSSKNSQVNNYIPLPSTGAPLVNCVTKYGVYTYMTQSQCDAELAWEQQLQQKPQQTIIPVDNTYNNQQCKSNAAQDFAEKKQGVQNLYGSMTDTADAIIQAQLTPEYQQAIAVCDQQYPLQ